LKLPDKQLSQFQGVKNLFIQSLTILA